MNSMRRLFCAATMLCASFGTANAGTVIGGSDLLVGGNLSQIESWLVNDPQLTYNGSLTFTNIYDAQAGHTSLNFHSAADFKGPTIVLLEATDQNGGATQIIGGFNPQSWNSSGTYNITPPSARTAFIFNLTTGDRRDQLTTSSNGQFQTYNELFYGPIFGGGMDIYVTGNFTTGNTVSYTYCADPSVAHCNGAADLLGSINGAAFNLGRLEVFTIAETFETPLPAALPLFATVLAGGGLIAWRRKRKAAPSSNS